MTRRATADGRGRPRITLHHNLIEDSGQRTPRVRFGRVHVYNNYFEIDGIDPADVIYDWGTQITVEGTLVSGRSRHDRVDLVEVYNAEHDPDLGPVSWEPALVARMHPTRAVPAIVSAQAGAGRIS